MRTIVTLAALIAVLHIVLADRPDSRPTKAQAKGKADDLLSTPGKLNKAFKDMMDQCWFKLPFKKSLLEEGRKELFRSALRQVSADNAGGQTHVSDVNCFSLLDQDEMDAFTVLPVPTESFRRRLQIAEDSQASMLDIPMGRRLKGKSGKAPPSPIRRSPVLPPSPVVPPSPVPAPSPRPTVTCPYPCDWRNVNGLNYVPPTRDQMSCASCSFFSAVATWESLMLVRKQLSAPLVGGSFPLATSTQYPLNCAPNMGPGQTWSTNNNGVPAYRCQWGGMAHESWAWLRSWGQINEATLPYSSSTTGSGPNGANYPCTRLTPVVPAPAGMAPSNTIVLDRDGWVSGRPTFNNGSVALIKAALVDGPLTVTVRTDFGQYSSGVRTCTPFDFSNPWGSSNIANHQMVLVGNKPVVDANGNTQDAWVLLNSWGSGWGTEGGYIYITTDPLRDCGVSQWAVYRPDMVTGTAP